MRPSRNASHMRKRAKIHLSNDENEKRLVFEWDFFAMLIGGKRNGNGVMKSNPYGKVC